MHHKILFCITQMRYEEKRILNYIKQNNNNDVDVFLDSMDFEKFILSSDEYDLAIIRIMSHRKAIYIAECLEALNIRTINTSYAIRICSDKVKQALLFKNNNVISQPAFEVLTSFSNVGKKFENLNSNIVIKPVSGSWGRNIVHINNINSIFNWVNIQKIKDPKGEKFPYLIQEYINKPNYDIRVVIIGSNPIVAFKRVSSSNWKTNTHLGAQVEPIPITEYIKKVSNYFVSIIGEGIYGLDLMDDEKGNTYFCEINQNPEFSNSWKIHKVDVARKIADYIMNEL